MIELSFEHGDILIDNTDKTKTYSYSELYQIQNVGNIGELKESIRMHNHPDQGRTYSPPAKAGGQVRAANGRPYTLKMKPSLANPVPARWAVARAGWTERNLYFCP